MEIKYAYEMTRKAEEVREEIHAKNNALAREFIGDHIMPEIERVAGSAETETGNSQHHDEKHDARCPLKGGKAPAPHGNSVYSLP